MQVHLIAVEVGVVRRTDAQVEPEGASVHDPDAVPHHGHPVQRRLPVEQDHVPVDQLPLDDVVDLESLRHGLGVGLGDPDPPAVVADDVVGAGDVRGLLGGLGSAGDQLAHLLDVVLVHVHGHGELPGRDLRNTHFVDGEQGIGRDDGTGAEVDTLTGQVGPEASLLTLEPLREGLQGTPGPVSCGRNAGGLVVEVGGHVILKKFPKILDNQLGCTVVTVFPEPLVDPEDIHELVGEVVFGSVSGLQGD